MRGSAVVVVAGSLLASIIACGSFGADDPKPSVDAGASSSSSSSSSSSGDAGSTTSSSGVVSDFCQGAEFCDEYERDDAESPAADVSLLKFGDSAAIITDGHRGKAVQLRPGVGEPGEHIRFYVERDAPRRLNLSAWFRTPTVSYLPSSKHINLLDLTVFGTLDGDSDVAVVVVLNDDATVRLVVNDDEREYGGIPGDEPIVADTWTQVAVLIDFDTKGVAMLVGTKSVANTTLAYAMRSSPKVGLSIGTSYSEADKPFHIDIDDVRWDVE